MVAPCVALCACSSKSGSATNIPPMGDDASPTEDVSSGDDGGSADAAGGDDAAASTLAAGKSGADAFCAAICQHEDSCAVTLDASPSGLADCVSNCQSVNEAPSSPPPTEI